MADVQFFDPAKLPYRGMWSALSGLSLDKGEWLLGENIRVGDRTIRSRWGLAKTGSSPAVNPLAATGYCVGAKVVHANGTSYAMSGWADTGGIQGIYFYVQNLTTGAWTVLSTTAATDPYKATTDPAIFDSALCPVDFVTANDPRSGLDYIVILTSAATGLYDPTNSTFSALSDVSAPQETSGFSSIPTFPVSFSVKDNTAWAPTNSDADWAGTDGVASTTEDYIVLTRSTGAASDATVTVVFTSTIDLSNSRQLVMLCDSKTVDMIERIKVQVQEGAGSATTVWDPTTSNYRYEIIPAAKVQKDRQSTATETKFWVAFNLDHIAAASRNAVDTVIFTYIGAVAPSVSTVLNVYVIAGSGKVIGNSYHALTYLDSATRVESQPVFPKVQPELVKNVGGATLNNMRLPFDQRLFYTYTVGYQNPAAQTQVNKVVIYRLDPGDPDPTRYAYVGIATITAHSTTIGTAITGATAATPIVITTSGAHTLYDGDYIGIVNVVGVPEANGKFYADSTGANTFALYSDAALTTGVAGTGAWTSGGTVSGWLYSSGTPRSILTYSDTTVSSSRNLKILAPFPACRRIPNNCFCGISLGQRLIVGRWKAGATPLSPSFSELLISEYNNPFRFYDAPYLGDPLSGGTLRTTDEVIYGFAQSAAGGYGSSILWTFTDKNVYRSFGPSVQGLMSLGGQIQHGTKYRDTIATYRDSVFWLDYNQDVMKFSGGGLQNLSRNVVSDQLTGAALITPVGAGTDVTPHKAVGQYYKNRYYLAVNTASSDSASTMRKTRVMVWDDTYNVWSRDTWASTLSTDYLFQRAGTLYGVSNSNRYVYTLEDGSTTTDDSTAYAMNLTTGTIHQDFQQGLEVTRCWVLMDDAASGTAAWTATYLPDGSTRGSGSKSVDVSGSYVLRELRAVGGSNRGAGVTGSVAFVFTVPGGTRVYGISAEIQPVPLVPTAV